MNLKSRLSRYFTQTRSITSYAQAHLGVIPTWKQGQRTTADKDY